jgi:hypothetical protein
MARRPSLSITGHGPSTLPITAKAAAASAPAMMLEVQFTIGVWTDITVDTIGAYGMRLRYGINGNGPLDRVSSTGEMQFTLRNDARNSGSTRGWYSPAHASCRSGWTFGIPVRLAFNSVVNGIFNKVKFRGKVRVIAPAPGIGRGEYVTVTAYDFVRDLAEANAREVTVQIDQTEDALFHEVIDSLPVEAQPPARDFDTGVDAYPVAFDDVDGGVKALSLIADLARSAVGMFVVIGDGTARYRSRQTIALSSSSFTFSDTMTGLVVPSSFDKFYNRVRATNHLKVISPLANEELYTIPTTLEVPAGETVTVWCDYNDPNDRQTHVGGTAFDVPLVANTHYVANSAEDGSGVDLTGFISASIDPFSSTAKVELTNGGVAPAFMTTLKIVGKAIRDPGPQTFETYVPDTRGDRLVEMDLRYQDSAFIAQSACDYIFSLYNSLTSQVEMVEFIASKSDAFMAQALLREPGDRITLSETMTGLSSVDAVIQSVEFIISGALHTVVRWGLSPATATQFWQWGIVGRSEWGETTIYGF